MFDDNRLQCRERYRIFRCLHNIMFHHAINLINWHDIENDCNNSEISKYRSFFTRNSRWLWQNQKIHWFDFRKNRENFCAKINNETHREFASFQIIRIDKHCSYIATFWTNSTFCHQICRMILRSWCFVDLKKRNFFRRISLFFDVCWFERSCVFKSFRRYLVRNWECFASFR